MKIIDRIISDMIQYTIERGNEKWKWRVIVGFTSLISMNLLSLNMYGGELISRLGIVENFNPFIIYNFLVPGKLNTILNFLLTIYFPSFLLTYFLVFFKARYKKLLLQYKYQNGKQIFKFFVLTIGVLIIPLVILIIIDTVFG